MPGLSVPTEGERGAASESGPLFAPDSEGRFVIGVAFPESGADSIEEEVAALGSNPEPPSGAFSFSFPSRSTFSFLSFFLSFFCLSLSALSLPLTSFVTSVSDAGKGEWSCLCGCKGGVDTAEGPLVLGADPGKAFAWPCVIEDECTAPAFGSVDVTEFGVCAVVADVAVRRYA